MDFKVGETVWTILDNKPQLMVIRSITENESGLPDEPSFFTIVLRKSYFRISLRRLDKGNNIDDVTRKPKNIFKTKEGLIESLR